MNPLDPTANNIMNTALARALHQHWPVLLAEGIILMLLGLAAIVIPPLAGLAATIWLGAIFLLGGIVGLVATFRARSAPGFGWAIASAILAIIAGLVLLWNPVVGLISLTYVMIAYFIFDGITMIMLALEHRRELSGRWEWILVNGVIDLFLAGIILSGMPGSSAWALGLLLGIDLVFGGSALVAMALSAKNAVT